MSNFIKGENGVVFIYDSVGMAYKPVACLTSTSFNSTVSIIESMTKCAPGVTEKDYGIKSYQITMDGQYIDTTTVGGDAAKASHDFLWDLQNSGTKVDFKFDTDITNVDSVKYYGKAIISDLPLTMDSGDSLATFSATFDVDGGVTKTDPFNLAPVITSSNAISVTNGASGTFQVVATNPPITSYNFVVVAPPSGMTINTVTGLISWTNAVPVGIYERQLVAFNAYGQANQNVIITVTA